LTAGGGGKVSGQGFLEKTSPSVNLAISSIEGTLTALVAKKLFWLFE
jgi:hypothetical protein